MILNPYLDLIAFPGMVLLKHRIEGRDSETEFASPAPLGKLYAYMHAQLTERGWERIDVEWEPDEIEAHYARGDEHLELELEYEDDRFELEIAFDEHHFS